MIREAAVVGSAALWICQAGSAQVTIKVEIAQGEYDAPQDLAPEWDSEVTIYACLDFGPNTYGVAEVDLTLGNDHGDIDVSLDLGVTNIVENIVTTMVENQLGVPPFPVLPCKVVQDYGHVAGNASLYSFAFGGGFSGGFSYVRRVTASVTLSDDIRIEGCPGCTIEIPLAVEGGVLAAESFGNPDDTWGKASLSASGAIGGVAVNEMIAVESVSVIPEKASIGVVEVVSFTIPADGVLVLTVELSCEAKVEARATSAGLFGSLAGSATALADFPDTIAIGRFTGARGGPLPPGTVISSLRTGYVYAQPSGAGPSDLNGDGAVDGADLGLLLGAWGGAGPFGDLDGDGMVDGADLGTLLGDWSSR